MKTRLSHRWEKLKTSFWFIPTLMVVSAVIIAIGMIILDMQTALERSPRFGIYHNVSPEGARTILTMIAQSLINVTSVAFSITIVALTLASSQFGPRLLRNFMVDTGNQIVLGTFISTFVYCLLILRIITTNEEQTFVPSLSISLAVILAMVNVGVLIYFIHHVAISIQADHVVDAVRKDLEDNIEEMFPNRWERVTAESTTLEGDPSLADDWIDGGQSLVATKSGYLQAIDKESLVTFSKENNFILKLQSSPGDFIIAGQVLMTIKCVEGACVRANTEKLIHSFFLGSRRTPEQDPEFAIRQLVEIAIRALSPSLNDPFTAMICIDQLGSMLCQLTQRRFPSPYGYDDEGNLRLIEKPMTFTRLTKAAFDQVRQYGRSSTAVTMRLLESLTAIAEQTCTLEQRQAVLRQADMIERISHTALPEENDREDVQQRYRKLVAIVERLERVES